MNRQAPILSAWLLHSRPYRETSLLLDFLTLEHGRVSAIAKGVRNSRNKGRSSLQPFIPLHISLAGKHELQNLRSYEMAAAAMPLQGSRLFAGFYLNELLIKLLPAHEAERALFDVYTDTISALSQPSPIEPLLRQFELRLLESLGYGLQLEHDAHSGECIEELSWYYLQADSGFVKQLHANELDASTSSSGRFPGAELLKIASGDYSAPSTLKYAKQLLRSVLHHHLGGKALRSRDLFRKRVVVSKQI